MTGRRVLTVYLLALAGFMFGAPLLLWAAITISAYSTYQVCKEDHNAVCPDH